jgi:hypothetical protein
VIDGLTGFETGYDQAACEGLESAALMITDAVIAILNTFMVFPPVWFYRLSVMAQQGPTWYG